MRVIAGSAKGRVLATPTGDKTRPTSNRAREATMSALISLDALDGATIVDLFAGSGALGIESLSRGAAHATFVESDRAALVALRANLDTTAFVSSAAVVPMDVLAWLNRDPDGLRGSLVFADPPYAFDQWQVLLDHLHRAEVAMVVAERGTRSSWLDLGDSQWDVIREAKYASAIVTFLRPISLT